MEIGPSLEHGFTKTYCEEQSILAGISSCRRIHDFTPWTTVRVVEKNVREAVIKTNRPTAFCISRGFGKILFH